MAASLVVTLAAVVSTGALDVTGRVGLVTETRGGYVDDGTTPTRSSIVDLQVTPSLEVTARDAARLAIAASYAASFLSKSREPSLAPMVLHTFALAAADGNRKGDALRLHLSAISGPLDYDEAARDLGADGTIAAFPRGGVVSYANADLLGTAYEVLTRRWASETNLSVGYTGPSVTDVDADIIPRQYRAGVQQRLDYLASRRATVSASVLLTGVSFENRAEYLGVTPGAAVRYRLTRQETVSLRVGLQVTRTLLGAEAGAGHDTVVDSLEAVGNVALTSARPLSRRTLLTVEARGDLAPFYDPFRGVLVQRAVASLLAEVAEKRGRSASLRVQWYEPLRGTSPIRSYDVREQRLAAAGLTLGTPLGRHLSAQAGVVALERWDAGSRVTGVGAAPEVLGFVTLSGHVEVGRLGPPEP